MRFTSIVAASILAIAVQAQDKTTAAESPAATNTGLDPKVKACLDACPPEDVNCLAHCTPVPSPNEDNLNALHECVGKCDQGDGSEAATVAYGNCVQECVTENYYDPEIGTPNQPGAGSGSGSGSGSDSGSGSGSGSGSDSGSEGGDGSGDGAEGSDPTGTGSAPQATESGGAAAGLVASIPLAMFGLAGAVYAI